MRPTHSLLQPILLPTSLNEQDMYVRKLGGELVYGDQLSSYGQAHLSFNTYMNSFYEDYWVKHTSVARIELFIRGQGRFWCNIFRETAAHGCVLIGRHFIDLEPGGVDEVCLPVSLIKEGHGHGGRIFTDLKLTTASVISEMAWCTADKPRQAVSIGVGICTFNREAFVVRTVEKLISAPSAAALARVVVVNQGQPLLSDAFSGLTRRSGPRLSIYAQGNFGGAGGFTRSAIELLKDRSITHILFMDDDIELDARHLVTTAAFLRYARKPLAVGGHMLDLYRRNILYEAGNSISPDNHLRPNHQNRDLYDLSTLSALSRASPSHFNGWWYTAIPAEAFREHGLPVPIFIRGDDLEYGVRINRAGIETVALPPVSVWHEPFYAKAPGWQLYYDLRNRLIFASLHDEMFSLDSPARLLKLLMVHLIKHDYQHAWFMMQAVCDFLKGPELLQEGLPEIHGRVTKGAATLAPKRLDAPLGLDVIPGAYPDRPWALRGRMLGSLARVLIGRPHRRPYGIFYADLPLQWVKLGPRYVLSDRDGYFFLKFEYSAKRAWTHLWGTAGAILRYRRTRTEASQAWKAAYPQLVSPENWHAILGLERDVPEAMAISEAA